MEYSFENNKNNFKKDTKGKILANFEITPFFNNAKKETFYTELGLLLQAKIPVKESLLMIIDSNPKKVNQDFYTSLLDRLNNGFFFYQSIKQLKNVSSYEWNTIKIGEETGQLGQVVRSLANFFKHKNSFRRTINSALAYPILLLTTAFFVILFMLTTIVPLFQGIFDQQGIEIPIMTQWVVGASTLIKDNGLYLLIAVVFIAFGIRLLYQQIKIRQFLQSLFYRLPVLGSQMRINYSFQFSQTMSLLTDSHVTLTKSLSLMKIMFRFYPLQKALEHIYNELEHGKAFGTALRETSFFDSRMHSFIHVGEETNQLDVIFRELTVFYHEKMMQRSKRFTNLLEPLIIIFVGSLIGVILVAMYLPMFQLSTTLG